MSNLEVIEQILELLDINGVEYELTEHEPVCTSQQAAKLRRVDLSTGAKAMIIQAKDEYFLFVLQADKKIDWKKVKKILGVTRTSLAPIPEVEKTTGVKVGGIPPFGNILGLKTYFDKGILDVETVNFNAGSRTHSVSMKSKDLVDLVRPEIVEFAVA